MSRCEKCGNVIAEPKEPKRKSLAQKIISALSGSEEIEEEQEYDSPYGNTFEDEDDTYLEEEENFGVWE